MRIFPQTVLALGGSYLRSTLLGLSRFLGFGCRLANDGWDPSIKFLLCSKICPLALVRAWPAMACAYGDGLCVCLWLGHRLDTYGLDIAY